jgi:photosystem II stability/assembly factor-like uncharacterized protein
MAGDYILNAEGGFFYQLKRSEAFAWLTCTGVGDIDIPMGDATPMYCPDPLNSGRFRIEGFVRGDAGPGTYRIERPLFSVYTWFMHRKSAFQGRVNWTCRGSRMDPQNYEIAVILHGSEPTRRGVANPTRLPDGTNARVLVNSDLNFIQELWLYRLRIARQTVINTANGNSVFFLPERPEDRCGPARDLCEYGIIGLDRAAGYLYDSEVKYTKTGGSTWIMATVDPFTWGGHISKVWIFETLSGSRWVTFRESPVIGAPAESAYSVDEGVSWANRTMGTLLNQGINDATLCGANMIAVGTGGYIYVSSDQANSWTVQEAGVETAQDLNGVIFHSDQIGYAVGNSNAFLTTNDGGQDWAAGTGPAAGRNLLTVAVNDQGHIFIGTNDGRLFRSEDGGDTWTAIVDMGVGTIDDIQFDEATRYIGLLVWNTAAPVGAAYRSEDGGATWFEAAEMPANSGINDAFMCDHNHFAFVGEAHGGSTFIAMASPAS